MARLSDLIKKGKVTEKGKKDHVKLRDLEGLKEAEEETVETAEEEKPKPVSNEYERSEETSELDLPTEAKEEKLVEKPEEISLDKISLPSEEELAVPSKEELEERKRIEDLYKKLYNFLEGVINSLKKKQRFDIDKGLEIISEIVNTEKAVDTLYGKGVQSRDAPDNLITHSANVSIYSIMLGIGLGFSSNQLIELGITALLHDIGMFFVPEAIVKKSGKLTDKELRTIKKHPYYTYKILQTLGKKYAWIAEIAYQEQEREGGQGYPRGRKGDEIHPYAKIMGVADVYEALIHHRPQRKSYMPHDAVKLIIGTQKEHFSNEIKRVLLKKLSCFPLNSYVKLNSKAIGRVIEINEDSPLRPTIELLFDSQGRRLPKKKVVRLNEAPLLYIIDTAYESDLPR